MTMDLYEKLTGDVNYATRSTLRSLLDTVELAFESSGMMGGMNNQLCLQIKSQIKDRVNRYADAINLAIAQNTRPEKEKP